MNQIMPTTVKRSNKMNLAKSSDLELLQAFYQGNNKAFDELERRYRKKLQVRCFYSPLQGCTPAVAMEVAARTLIRVMRTRNNPAARFDPAKSNQKGGDEKYAVWNWMVGILLREYNARYRAKTPAKGDESETAEEGPETGFILRALRECILALPDDFRGMLELKMEGASQKEIAEVFHTSPPTVTRRFDLKKGEIPLRLRECLGTKGIDASYIASEVAP